MVAIFLPIQTILHPTTLDSLLFAEAKHKNAATELGTAVTRCRQHQ